MASANGDASFSQGELSSKAARDCREDKERSPAFGGDGDGTCEFEAAVAQLLLTFEEGRDPATFLAGLPLYSVELEAMSPAEMREQLCRLVAAYEFDALTAEEIDVFPAGSLDGGMEQNDRYAYGVLFRRLPSCVHRLATQRYFC